MITIPPNIAALLAQQTKRLALGIDLLRIDGTSVRVTTHQSPLTIEGNVYTTIASRTLASRRDGGLGISDSELEGALSSVFTLDDLIARRWDGCQMTRRHVDWRYPFGGVLYREVYWLDAIRFDGEHWNVQVSDEKRHWAAKIGRSCTRDCAAHLGDARCKVSLPSFTSTGVHAIGFLDGEQRLVLRANPSELSGALPDGYFNEGQIIWTSGANNGLSAAIRGYVAATRDISLQLKTAFPMALTDTFNLIAGCDGRRLTCIGVFNNVLNFVGDPFIPGTDRVLRVTPRA